MKRAALDPMLTPCAPDTPTESDAGALAGKGIRPAGAASEGTPESSAARGASAPGAASTAQSAIERPRGPCKMQHVSFESALAAGLDTLLLKEALRSR